MNTLRPKVKAVILAITHMTAISCTNNNAADNKIPQVETCIPESSFDMSGIIGGKNFPRELS